MKDIVFFDLDGTLIDQGLRYYRIYKEICNVLDIKPMLKSEYWNKKRNKIPEKDILLECGADNSSLDPLLLHRIHLLEEDEYLLMDTLQCGILNVLEQLSSSYLLIVVTFRHDRETLLRQLRNLLIDKFFGAILSSELKTIPPYIGKVILIKNWLNNKQCNGWFFGDTETDILAGNSLGFRTIAVSFGIRSKNILKDCKPNYLIKSWNTEYWPRELVNTLNINFSTVA